MKYKKHIVTGVLALSLLVGGTSVSAYTPQDLGIKNVERTHLKQNRNKEKNLFRGAHPAVGTVFALTNTGFTLNVKNFKSKEIKALDIKTDASTKYTKNGVDATVSDLALNQKVIVFGELDKNTNILTAKEIRIVTDREMFSQMKKKIKRFN